MPFDQAVQVNPPVHLERGRVYPFVDMQAVAPSSRTVGPSEYREFEGGGSRFATGDTLMARITPCLENGKIARFRIDENDAVGHGSTEFIVIRGRPGVTDNGFAYYLTRWDGVRGYAISQMTGSSGRQRVPTEALSHLEVSIPSLAEQRAIAAVLGALDDKIELNRRMCRTLEGIARAVFQSWFVDFLPVRAKAAGAKRFRGMPQAVFDTLPTQFVDSPLGPIPKGWRVQALDEIADFLNGLALQKFPPHDGRSLPVIKIAQLRAGHTAGADQASADIDPAYVVGDGDVLFSWSGSLECILWAGGPGALNQHLFKVTSDRSPKWFYYHWIHHHLDHFRHIAAGKATTMGHIQRHHLSEAKVVVPPPGMLRVADELLAPTIDAIPAKLVQARTLAALRDALLPKLVSGELRIRDVERIIGRCA
jgi:type I restriction enzyme S subunit